MKTMRVCRIELRGLVYALSSMSESDAAAPEVRLDYLEIFLPVEDDLGLGGLWTGVVEGNSRQRKSRVSRCVPWITHPKVTPWALLCRAAKRKNKRKSTAH